MKCKRVRALLSAFDSDEVSATERNMIERHLSGCADCWAALAAYRALRGQFALLEHVSVDAEIADETISRIRYQGVERQEQPHSRQSLVRVGRWIKRISSVLRKRSQ